MHDSFGFQRIHVIVVVVFVVVVICFYVVPRAQQISSIMIDRRSICKLVVDRLSQPWPLTIARRINMRDSQLVD